MFKRNSHGIIELKADSNIDFAYKQGQSHAKDRMVQLMLTRLVAQGRLSECLASNDETKEIDTFMRSMNFTLGASEKVKNLDTKSHIFLQSYCDGINDYQKKHKRPIEFIISKYKPEPWKIEDSIMIVKIMSYMGLAQSQEDIEKIIIEKIQAGTDLSKLKSLYTPHLDNLDKALYDKIANIKNHNCIVPEEVRFSKLIPKVIASNNWVISSKNTKNKSALQCNDPHLEINRLPAIWYETIADISGNKITGVTMPGIPGLLMGRNSYISFGFTYGFMDMIDFFIEEVKDNKVIREDGQHFNIITKEEILIQKDKSSTSFFTHRSDLGKIECPNDKEKLEDGFYFCRAWSGESSKTTDSLISAYEYLDCKTTKEFCESAKKVTISCNWLVSDTNGNIAYQQSGPLPIRKDSGLYPLEASKQDNHWKGIYSPDKLGQIHNPEKGYIATANQQITFDDKPLSINMPMGNYRYLRVKELIENSTPNDIDFMKKMQSDLYSKQAELYIQLIKPYFDNSYVCETLKKWDLNYNNKSVGATIFEDFYIELIKLVFTNDFLSIKLWNYLESKTNILIDYFDRFDHILLSKSDKTKALWFKEVGIEVYIKKTLSIINHKYSKTKAKAWGTHRKVTMENIFFAGKLPSFLKLDHGPISIQGNRATICQGQVFKLHDRQSSFCPSYRYICDLKDSHVYTVLAGGVSDRPMSKFYKNDIKAWLNFEYKII